MGGTLKHYLILNLTVFAWGFTGVLGKEISLGANEIVFFRMGIAFISLVLIGLFYSKKETLTRRQISVLLLTGAIVGLHWFTFFHSIKVSKVSITVVCMSSATLFTAILEPLIFRRKVLGSELILSAAIVVGITIIIGFEPGYLLGIAVGLLSAFLAALFNVLNGRHIQYMSSFQITKYEMLGGLFTMTLILGAMGAIDTNLFILSRVDWVYLIILGLVCTTAAFLVSVWLMKFLSPFTVSMSLNMEPIYAILIVLILDFYRGEESEKMTSGFYLGTVIIIGSIFLNAYVKKKNTTQ